MLSIDSYQNFSQTNITQLVQVDGEIPQNLNTKIIYTSACTICITFNHLNHKQNPRDNIWLVIKNFVDVFNL